MKEMTITEAREAFRVDAISWAQTLDKADGIGRRAFHKVAQHYSEVGADIIAKGLTYGQAAWIANYTEESEAEYREECHAQGKQARPMGQQTFRRAWQIGKRMNDDGVTLAELLSSYDGVETLDAFAKWCGGEAKAEPKAPKHPTEYLAEALRKCVNGGVDMADVLRMVDKAYSAA